MKLSFLLPAAAALALIAGGAAMAQQASDLREVDDDDRIVQPFGLSVDDIEDMDVYDAAGEELGEVEEVLENSAGEIVAVSVDFDDDWLDFDDDERVVALDRLQLDDDRFVSDLDKAEVEGLPVWDD